MRQEPLGPKPETEGYTVLHVWTGRRAAFPALCECEGDRKRSPKL